MLDNGSTIAVVVLPTTSAAKLSGLTELVLVVELDDCEVGASVGSSVDVEVDSVSVTARV